MALDTARPTLETIGDYDLLEKIAEGGMGTVYKARQRSSGNIVAMKILTAHLAKNTVLVKRFEQEYKSAKSLNHPNLVRALDFGYHEECPYLVMEFVDGETVGEGGEGFHEGAHPKDRACRWPGTGRGSGRARARIGSSRQVSHCRAPHSLAPVRSPRNRSPGRQPRPRRAISPFDGS